MPCGGYGSGEECDEERQMSEIIHSFEDGIELCLSALEDSKTLEDARKKIEAYLASARDSKLAQVRIKYLIFKDKK
jgi:hypothetical protein